MKSFKKFQGKKSPKTKMDKSELTVESRDWQTVLPIWPIS